jgi:hypothetical protein
MTTHPTITFSISPADDFKHTYGRLRSYDPSGIATRIKKKGIEPEVAEAFFSADDRKERNEIWRDYLNNFYEKHAEDMEKARNSLSSIWSRLSPEFFRLTNERMGNISWQYSEYHFLVSSFFSSSVWGTGNELAIWWRRAKEGKFHVVGQELILAHFFETIYTIYSELPVSEWKIWALAEIVSYLLVYTDTEITETLWPELRDHEAQLVYPGLEPHVEEIQKLLEEKGTYQDFTVKAIAYIENESERKLRN